MKTIACKFEGCGKVVEAKSNRQSYCPEHKAIVHAERHRINVAAHQVRRKKQAEQFGICAKWLDRHTVRTRKQVAEIMGVTEECVRVAEISAMNKIRRALGKYV